MKGRPRARLGTHLTDQTVTDNGGNTHGALRDLDSRWDSCEQTAVQVGRATTKALLF